MRKQDKIDNELSGWINTIRDMRKDLNKESESLNEKEIYRQALNKWKDKQIVMVFEEMAELQKELCKSLRGKENRVEIAEEIADVEIMLGQMKLYYGIEEGVKRHKELKLKKLEERVKE